MSVNISFILYYVLTMVLGICLAYDIKHPEKMPFWIIVIHMTAFISDIYWGVYYFIQIRGGAA